MLNKHPKFLFKVKDSKTLGKTNQKLGCRARRWLIYCSFSFSSTCTESLTAKHSCTCIHTRTVPFSATERLHRGQGGPTLFPAHRSTSPNTISWVPRRSGEGGKKVMLPRIQQSLQCPDRGSESMPAVC